jgi:predicted nucleic acid-binding protein
MSIHPPLLIYLDANVYSRPFYDQTNEKIRAEANAFLKILAEAKAGTLNLLSSGILNFEVDEIPDEEKHAKIKNNLEFCKEHIRSSEDIFKLGKAIQKDCHIRARDAFHIASAILGNARYFLSCDDKVTQKKQTNCYRRHAKNYKRDYFSVMNPTLFLEQLSKGKLI